MASQSASVPSAVIPASPALVDLRAFPQLHAECAGFPLGGILALTREQVGVTPQGCGACPDCCRWTVALEAPYCGRRTTDGVPLYYNEWLAWHWHVRTHQTLDARSA